VQQPARAHHNLTSKLEQKAHDPLLARLEHARAGDARGDAVRLHALDRRAQPVQLQVV